MRLSDIVRSGQRPPDPRAGESGSRPAGGIQDVTRPAAEPPPERPAGRPPEVAPATPPAGPRPEPGGPRAEPGEVVFQTAVERIRHSLAVRAQAPFSIDQAAAAVAILCESLETSDALLAPFFGRADATGNPARRAVNVCILALKIGLELGYPREQLRGLGLAALLCDVGISLAPGEMLESPEPFSPRERAALREHQLDGAAHLLKMAPDYRWLAEVIRHRYENADGPHRPSSQFEEYAAIIHLAEIYESLVHPRPSRKRVAPLDALKEILQRHRTTFPDPFLKALIRAMSTFPVGSLVRLNTGDVARVVQRNKDFPLRPAVEVLVRRGRRLDQPVTVDLAQSPLLHIKESVVEDSSP